MESDDYDQMPATPGGDTTPLQDEPGYDGDEGVQHGSDEEEQVIDGLQDAESEQTSMTPIASPSASGPGSPAVSCPASPERSNPDSPEGSGPASPEGSDPGSPEAMGPTSPEGSAPGSPEGSSPGSPEGSGPASPEELGPASPEGSGSASSNGSNPASPTGSASGDFGSKDPAVAAGHSRSVSPTNSLSAVAKSVSDSSLANISAPASPSSNYSQSVSAPASPSERAQSLSPPASPSERVQTDHSTQDNESDSPKSPITYDTTGNMIGSSKNDGSLDDGPNSPENNMISVAKRSVGDVDSVNQSSGDGQDNPLSNEFTSAVHDEPDETRSETEDGPASPVTDGPNSCIDERSASPMDAGPASQMDAGPASPMGDDGPASPMGDDGPASPMGDDGPASSMGDGPASPVGAGSASPMDNAPKSPMDDGPRSPMDDSPRSPMEDGPKSPIDDEPKSPIDDGSRSPMDNEPKSPIDDVPKSPIDDGLKSPLDDGLQSPMDTGLAGDKSKSKGNNQPEILFTSDEEDADNEDSTTQKLKERAVAAMTLPEDEPITQEDADVNDDDSDKESEVGGLIADIFGSSDEDEEFEGFGAADVEKHEKEKKKAHALSSDEDDDVGIPDPPADTHEKPEPVQPLHDMSSDEEIVDKDRKTKNEDFVSDFDQMMARKKEEAGRRRKKRRDVDIINDNDDIIADLIQKMKEAAAQDRTLNEEKKPAIHKLKLLSCILPQLKKSDLHIAFLDQGILNAITEWLAPMPDKCLPHLTIRTAMLKQLLEFPPMSTELLKMSGIGKAVMYLYKNPKEVRINKQMAGKLINEWSRPIFNLTSNYKMLSREEREQRDYEHLPKKRRLTLEGKQDEQQDIDKAMAGEERALRPGDKGWVFRARVPQPSHKDYVVRPKWNVDEQPKGSGKKTLNRYEKHLREFKERQKQKKTQRAIGISIEGRNMQL